MDKVDSYGNYIVAGKEKNSGYAGGAFYELAQYVIGIGGSVVGAAYVDDFSVKHIMVNDIEGVKRLRGVKYAESIISHELRDQIKKMLQEERTILFAGVPCQIDLIRKFLKRDYKTFYTLAVKCSGVISAQIWRDYITEVQANGSIITKIDYPYRGEFGISQNKVLIKFSHGTAYFRDGKEDKLIKLRNAGLIFKEECYECAEKKEYRKADIYLNVYYDKNIKNAAQEEGLTAVRVNTRKGKKLFGAALSGGISYKEAMANIKDFDTVPQLAKPQNFEWFWMCYEHYGFSFASDMIYLQADSGFQERKMLVFLKHFALLSMKGLQVENILESWGIKKLALLGNDYLTRTLAKELGERGRICTILSTQEQEGNIEKNIIHSEIPVIIMPSVYTPNIMEKICNMGIHRKKILSMDMLVEREYEYKVLGANPHTKWDDQKSGIGELYLITGAQFDNKGAQSMLFTAVSELRRMHPECDIYYLPIDSVSNYPNSVVQKYRFHIIRREGNLFGGFYDIASQIKAIVDVGGYAFSSNWNCTYFIQIALLAKHLRIPIYYMPQSFGPFDFPAVLDKKVKEGFEWAQVIFAREEYGYALLTQKYGLRNIRKAKDLVLQNKKLILDNIYLKLPNAEEYHLITLDNVAIVPNMRNYSFGSKDQIIEIYRKLIEELLKLNKNIYIICHSKDEQACEDIYCMFQKNNHVFLYGKRLDCLEYSMLIREFQYIVASRYHAIVHAYKEGIPCIALGWAEKYGELLTLFGQEQYVFDVRKEIEIESFLDTVKRMNKVWKIESAKIQRILSSIQTENCFEVIG